MKQQDLEILLSQSIESFSQPKIEFEQYQTPCKVASIVLHRAYLLGDINDKEIIDLGAGTGILAIGAAILGANSTAVEIDPSAIKILKKNVHKLELKIKIIQNDIMKLNLSEHYQTALLNPPFGIQQKKYKDFSFIKIAHSLADAVYAILDGSPSNIEGVREFYESMNYLITEMYIEEFPLDATYPWHKLKLRKMRVLIVRSETH